GDNSCHEQAVDPDDLDWDLVEDSDHEDRLFLYADDEDVPAFAAAKAAQDAKHDAMLAATQGIDPEEVRGPFWRLLKALKAAGIQARDKFQSNSCYLHAVDTTGLFVLDFSWGT